MRSRSVRYWTVLALSDPFDEVSNSPPEFASAELERWRHAASPVKTAEVRDAEIEEGGGFGRVQDTIVLDVGTA